ncbi:M81 family metallopeptidase [Paraburkholderia tropica]|uniref:M81 family metallopeptidase n=1 Tax=Paraburkholderia tropica TaxID=92647 RepID=UPI002AB69682|nr:M81 family metallopeptidase [Paraburkholderia tropica]
MKNRTTPFRIALAGFVQESVTFVNVASTIEAFQATESSGAAMLDRHRGANTPTAGFIDVCEAAGCELVPLLYAGAAAAGPTTDEAYEHYVQRIVDGLAAAGPLDGVLLDLHGAMATPTRLDADAETLERVRAVVGQDMPLMLALDYHANIDQRTVDLVHALFGYHYSPHTDMAETGKRAARCMLKMLREEIRPAMVIRKPGVMVPSIFSATGLDPLKSIVDRSVAIANDDASMYRDVSVFAGFSYADVPNCGFSVVAVTNDDPAAAEELAGQFSDEIYTLRRELNHPELVYSIESGIAEAERIKQTESKPVVLLEHADRMGDSTYLLRAALERKLKGTAVPFLADAQAARAAAKAGVGNVVTVSVGGHSSERAGGPVTLTGTVVFAEEKQYFATGPYFTGRLIDLGLTVVIDTGEVVVSITSNQSTAVDDDCFKQLGLNIDDYSYIVLRSKTHFRAAYDTLASAILIVDTPDWGPADLTLLDYCHVPKDTTYPFST